MFHTPMFKTNNDRFVRTISDSDKDLYHSQLTGTETKKERELYDRITNSTLESFFPEKYGNTPSPSNRPIDEKQLIRVHRAYKILDAADVIDDYYLNCLDVNPRNQIAVALNGTCYICEFDTSDISEITSSDIEDQYICSVSYRTKLAIGYSNGSVRIISPQTDQVTDSIKLTGLRVPSITWRDENTFFFGDKGGNIFMKDVRSSHFLQTSFLTSEIPSIKISHDLYKMAVGSNQNAMAIWDIRRGFTPDPMIVKDDFTSCIKALDWCPWNDRLLLLGAGTLDKRINILNIQTEEYEQSINTGNQVTSVKWHEESRKIIATCGYKDNCILYLDTRLNPIYKLEINGRILCSAFNHRETKMVTLSSNEKLCFWNKIGRAHV